MTKLLKILGNSLLILMEIILIFIIAFSFSIRTSSFQSFLAHKTADYLSGMVNSKVSIGKVDIAFFNRVYFDELYIEDQHQDTLFYIHEFYVNYDLKEILKQNFDFKKVQISQARVNLRRSKGESQLNLQFFIDAFDSGRPSKKSDFKISVAKLKIKDSYFTYQDENKPTVPYGVDFDDLDLKKIELAAENVIIQNRSYEANFQTIAFQEKSGFSLSKLDGKALFNDNGLTMQKTFIKTGNSDINLNSFNLRSDHLSDFSRFVKAVKIEGQLDTSYVSFKDIAFFAPELEGMDDVVKLKGSTEKTVQELIMNDIFLQYGKGSVIQGNFSLPDFAQLSKENINQSLDYFSIYVEDLEQIQLPKTASLQHVKWPTSLKSINHFAGTNLNINGSLNDLDVRLSQLNSNVGSFGFKDEFKVQIDTSFTSFKITPKSGAKNQIKVENVAFDQILNDKNYGKLNGHLGLSSVIINKKGVIAKDVSGIFKKTGIFNYAYEYIILSHIDYTLDRTKATAQNEIYGNIYVRDENLDLSFDGFISIGNYLEMNANISLECAQLEQINPGFENRGELMTAIQVNAKGKDFNDFKGNLNIDSLLYTEDNESFKTQNFKGFIVRNESIDSLSIESDIVDAKLYGIVDYSKVVKNINDQVGKIFPALNLLIKDDISDELSHFKYDITFNEVNDLLSIFYPDLKIAEHAKVNGYYNGSKNTLQLDASADYLAYKAIKLRDVTAQQEISNQELLALIDVSSLSIKDSVSYREIHFTGLASKGGLDSQLLFEDLSSSRSNIEWFTDLKDEETFDIIIYPSYINLNEHKWNLNKVANINYSDSCFYISNLKFEHENQYISAHGQLSNSIDDRLYLDVMSLDLKELGNVLGPDTKLSGIANVSGYVTTPFKNLRFYGESVIEDFYINTSEVGVVGFGVNYESNKSNVDLFGDIFYRGLQTFQFNGFYSLEENKRDELNLNMKFKKTDISVVNEFLDPDIIQNLKGKLNGNIKVTGTFKKPILTGKVAFNEGMFNLAILGANMYFEGEIEAQKDGFYINQMPIRDQEGNTGYITGSLFHDNFKDFLYEIIVNLEDHPTKRLPNDRSKPLPVERFMVMNTTYDPDEPYYGDAYITGIVEISGHADNLSIVVNAKTKKGTKFVLPMYGPTTIEKDGFITFKKSGEEDEIEPKVDLTGVNLELNFEVTDDAEVKLIFNEKIGDEISAKGSGNLSLSVNQFNELAMEGTYTVSSGVYNFAMGPYKQNFKIAPGGTVRWVGDPYDAILDINAYYKTTANLSVVMPDVIEKQSSNNEEIYSYLTITGNMMSPDIAFDLEAPKASESGKAIISRIKSDKDELNKQFFSILISKSFMPLSGQTGSSGTSGAFLDLASTQINNILNKVAEGYNMNVNLESDDFSGQFSGEFGLSKAFLDNRLLISGSFGVGTKKTENGTQENIPNQSTFIGDVKIEYLLNENGTFRTNVFNESNNNYILQTEGRGQFTQGVGISYKEDFHNLEDFKLFQFFANMFRRKDKWIDIREKRSNKIPIPKEYLNNDNIIKEEE